MCWGSHPLTVTSSTRPSGQNSARQAACATRERRACSTFHFRAVSHRRKLASVRPGATQCKSTLSQQQYMTCLGRSSAQAWSGACIRVSGEPSRPPTHPLPHVCTTAGPHRCPPAPLSAGSRGHLPPLMAKPACQGKYRTLPVACPQRVCPSLTAVTLRLTIWTLLLSPLQLFLRPVQSSAQSGVPDPHSAAQWLSR